MKTTTIVFLSFLMISLNSCNLKEKKAQREEEQDVISTTLTEVGQTTPEFSYITLENDTFNINELKGKVVFINFFATSCPICIKELPFVESDIWDTYKNNENFELIVFGREHVADEIIAFKEKTAYTFNIVPDPDRKIYSLFAERYIPRNYILDREGKIIYQATGFNAEEFAKLKETIQNELNN
ncbi:MAG: TlpA disulfide reductase family protein [Bacteroidales bacterium]|jgi:peroxiredoxin|nr:TlpA disulfide reductase family protein [Bacteroidales bacterium]